MTNDAKVLVLKRINPENENLTPKNLKTFMGNENLSENEATETVFALQTFSHILYELISDQSNNSQSSKAA